MCTTTLLDHLFSADTSALAPHMHNQVVRGAWRTSSMW
jgi:hypothetical protein